MADIPVNANDALTVVTVTSAGQVAFDYDFRADNINDLKANFKRASGAIIPLVGGVDFTASGIGTATGGTITITSITDAVIDETVSIYRDTIIARPNDYSRDVFVEDLNAEQDKIFMILQEQSRDLKRASKSVLGALGYEFSPDLVDGDTLMKMGNIIVPGPNTDDLVNAEEYAEQAAASAVSASNSASAAADALEDLESIIGASEFPIDVYASFATVSIPSEFSVVRLSGYFTEGDGGGARYVRVGSQPSHLGKAQSQDGAWWELAESSPNILMFGARSGSASYAAANVVAINGALAYKSAKGGGRVLGSSSVFYMNSPMSFQGLVGVEFDGFSRSTTLKISAPFTGTELVTMRGTRNRVRGCVLDCSAIATASTWLSGARVENENTLDCGIFGCEIKDASFCGIWMNDSNGTYKHTRFIAEDNIITNVGWMGIAFIGTVNGRIRHNEVSRTGFTAIWADERNVGLRIIDNDVSKATAPYRIYDGPGSVGGVEKGFMIGYAPSNKDTIIAFNRCIDNRNANEDGIGLGEDGTEHGNCIIAFNLVQYAGLFGIDVASRATVMGNRIEEPAQSGIFMSLDLGGSIAQAIVKANTIRSCNGPYAIQISQNAGNPLTIADCEISSNIIVDYRGTPLTQYGIRIRKDNLTITNLRIIDNIAINIGTAGFINDGTGTDWPIFVSGNRWKNHERAVVGNFSTTGYEAFTLTNPAATDLTLMTGGYDGKEIDIYFNNGNTQLKPDWLNTLGGGSNRIIGLGNVTRAMAAGDSAKLRYRSGFGWQVISITDAF